MSKNNKHQIKSKFLIIKEMFDGGDYDIEKFDYLTRDLINILGGLTCIGLKGDEIIEGIKLDLWKDRVWHLIERAELLPEYKEEDKAEFFLPITDVDDEWYKTEEEVIDEYPDAIDDDFLNLN